MKTNLDWFPFYPSDLNDFGLRTVRRRFGNAGLGQFFILKSLIAKAENCELDLNDETKIEQLGFELDFETKELHVFLEVLVKTKLISIKKTKTINRFTVVHLIITARLLWQICFEKRCLLVNL